MQIALLYTNMSQNNVISIKDQVVPNSEYKASSGSQSFDGSVPQDTSVTGTTGVSNVNDTTVFVDDNDVSKTDESTVAHVSRSIFTLNDTQKVPQDIMNFLMKPIVLASGNFSSSDTYSLFNSHLMPQAAWNVSQGTLWTRKLQGYFGIRMDMRFRLVINANRFQQGRYCVGWTPLAGMKRTVSALKELAIVQSHNATLVQRTTLPHVEIDLCTGTSAELLVPFVSTQAFYPLNAILSGVEYSPLGYVNLYPYAPLSAPVGNLTAGYTLYVSFENIHLFGAASPQSGLGTSHREVSNKMNGPISGVAKAFSRGFKEFGSIPLLGSYAKDVSWIADRIANAANIFGFAKPTQGDSSAKMMLVNATNHTTVDGDADARSLGLINMPSTVVLDGLSGTTFDEMDISYIVRKYAWFRSTTWATTDVIGTLVSFNVNPYDTQYSAAGTLNYTPVSFVSRFFQQWRGSVKYRIKLVKTEFHSGRIAISFHPADENVYLGQSVYTNRIIVDIREMNTIEFVVPYISRYPWTQAYANFGTILVEVVDPLVAPSTVTQNITMLWEIAGGDDYEVSIPGSFDLSPTVIVPQSGLNDDKKIYSSTLGAMDVSADPLAATSFCIGEKITSIRALLKRFHPITYLNTTNTSLDNAGFSMQPDIIIGSNTAAANLNGFHNSDPYSMFASCYAMVRGGFRIRDTINTGLLSPTAGGAFPGLNSSFCAVLTTGTPGSWNNVVTTVTDLGRSGVLQPKVYQNLAQNNTLTVEVPQYTTTYARAKGDLILWQSTTPTTANNVQGGDNTSLTRAIVSFALPRGSVGGKSIDATYPLHNVFRAGADDLQLLTFISVPPMVVRTPSTYTGFY